MHIEVNIIDIRDYNIGISKGLSSWKSIWFAILFLSFIIPREICNMDMQ